MQFLFASTLVYMYLVVIYSTTKVICDILILTHNGGEMCVVMVYLMMSLQVQHSMLLFNKRITNIIAWPKSYQQKKILAFLLCVMMVNGLVSEVPFVNVIYSNFVMTTWTIDQEIQKGNMLLIGPMYLHYGHPRRDKYNSRWS